jgi:regulator of sigma D
MALNIEKIQEPQNSQYLSNEDILLGKGVHPLKTLKTYDSDDFEVFIQEWAYGFLQPNGVYDSVYRIGSTGDKGRDVIGYIDKEKTVVDYYQCKFYASALDKTVALQEIVKLLHHASKGDIAYPRKYYLIAPKDVNPKLFDFLHSDVELIRSEVRQYSEKHYKKNIDLEEWEKLNEFISDVDLSIFDTRQMIQIIDEHSKTRWYAMRFGGGLKPRGIAPSAPAKIKKAESKYVDQLLNAYSEKLGINVHSPTELQLNNLELDHFIRQRNAFYSAEHLRIYSRETFPPEYDEFEKFKADIFVGIITTANKSYSDNVQKIDAVTDRAIDLSSTGNMLANKIQNLDKHGVCHHLVNDDKINWK